MKLLFSCRLDLYDHTFPGTSRANGLKCFPVEEMVLPPYRPDDLDDVPEISKRIHEMPAMPNTEWLIEENQWRSMIQSYLACMAFMDDQVGKVLRALEKSKYAENTVVVLWSDHGYHLGEKGRTCKHSLWYRSTHVPLIFAGPGISPGTSSDAQVGLIDMYPTLTELCGLEDNDANEGHSLVPLIRNPRLEWEHPVYTSYGYRTFPFIWKNTIIFITRMGQQNYMI